MEINFTVMRRNYQPSAFYSQISGVKQYDSSMFCFVLFFPKDIIMFRSLGVG